MVSDKPESIPDRNLTMSKGVPIQDGPEERDRRAPTDREMRIVSTTEAMRIFGAGADIIDGVTVSYSMNSAALPH